MSPRKPAEHPLSEAVALRQRFIRSANVERDADPDDDVGYIPTGRSLEVLRRFVKSSADASATRAWSLTGPYGAGKSSFALFLDALVGGSGDASAQGARAVLAGADPALADELSTAMAELGADADGFLRAVVTAQREPATATLARAMHVAAERRWGRRLPAAIRRALNEMDERSDSRSLQRVAEALAAEAPLLILIDEFGKNIEHFVDGDPDGDLFVLQELAELTANRGGRVFVMTLQHLALDDYVSRGSGLQRREWSKIQGRFEEISFVETGAGLLRLVESALDASAMSAAMRGAVKRWASDAERRCRELGISATVIGDASTIANCYPIHPVALAALPELCARFGQHGRTLFSFLASGEPHSLRAFLDEHTIDTAAPATVGLDRVYDYFVESAGGMVAAASEGSRLLEIATRIREAQGLDPEDERCIKVVGLLNLISAGGALRASTSMVTFALGDGGGAGSRQGTTRRLHRLEKQGLLTYREFADEYRIWHGTDIDLKSAVLLAREQLRPTTTSELLSAHSPMSPTVAGRHTQRVGMLRFFDVVFADESSATITAPGPGDHADGLVVYFVGEPDKAASLPIPAGLKPVIVATTSEWSSLADAALELAAVMTVLSREDVAGDWVARRELQERAAVARRQLSARLAGAFGPAAADVTWTRADTGETLDGRRGLSRMLSDLCDDIYRASPELKNEMIGRSDLSSQGAKARRELIEAMLARPTEERLGIDGFGPERAIYEATLHKTGIHRRNSGGGWRFGPPSSRDSLSSVWRTMSEAVDRSHADAVSVRNVYDALMQAPIGLKEGPIPLLLVAFLQCRHEDVAIYQDGTYQPVLTADLVERLIKTPERFALKRFDLRGSRQGVLEAIAIAVGRDEALRPRNASVLAVAAPLLSLLRRLPQYTLRASKGLSETARAVRTALLEAREPDELLFRDLPRSCGGTPFSPGRRPSDARAAEYADQLAAAIAELSSAFNSLRGFVRGELSGHLSLPSTMPDLRLDLRARARRLEGQVIDPSLRSFLFTAADDHLDDEDWLEAIGLAVSDRPPASWRDEDVSKFVARLGEIAGLLGRVEALHFDALASGGEGFLARRVSVTAPDGQERRTVVWVDETKLGELAALADRVREEARHLLGGQGEEALLAVLSERVLGPFEALEAEAPNLDVVQEAIGDR